VVHQQGGWSCPVARVTSIAHRFCFPHKGHWLGSNGRAWVVGLGMATV
jgi:hypothetical protein